MRRFSVVVLVVLFAFSAFGGAPLKGVDVKLGKNPGGGAQARATTDEHGAFTFGVLPRGSYWLSFEMKSGTPPVAEVQVDGQKAEWNLRTGRRIASGTGAAAKAGDTAKLVVTSDGSHPVQGTIVKSKSNISNN